MAQIMTLDVMLVVYLVMFLQLHSNPKTLSKVILMSHHANSTLEINAINVQTADL